MIVAGSLVLVLAGARETAGIIGPAFLALVLTITVHPVRRALVRRNVPDWLVAIAVVLSVYFLLFSVSIALVISAGRLAELLPQYQDEFSKYTADVTNWLASLGRHQGPGHRRSASRSTRAAWWRSSATRSRPCSPCCPTSSSSSPSR